MPILPPLPQPQRRHIHKISHARRDKGHVRRLMTILLLREGRTITDVHHLTGAARSTIGCWLLLWSTKSGHLVRPSLGLTCREDCHLTGAAHGAFSARLWLSA